MFFPVLHRLPVLLMVNQLIPESVFNFAPFSFYCLDLGRILLISLKLNLNFCSVVF